MALNKEVWINQILQNFYPDDSFLKKTLNFSEFVDNNKIHIPSAGIDPQVLINNTTYPIKIVDRQDDDNIISLDKFETENTIVRRPDAIEYSYDKLESVISQHRSTLRKSVAMKAIHAFAPTVDDVHTPVIRTTGNALNGRKVLKLDDILALKERFDDAEIPMEERYLVLHPKHVSDLLREDIKLFKDITNLTDGEPMKFAGFGMFSFSQMPTYKYKTGELKKVPFGSAATARFASVAFYGKEVMRADGDIYMYSKVDDPEERATIVGFDKRFIALPIRNIGIGAIVSDVSIGDVSDE
ncbi:MAG: hypothetical protein LBH22_01605 [Bacteroidales bacterium]|jgi:hypothetical protein|nr:hypothetical protein [Bacteroidales bacterium]